MIGVNGSGGTVMSVLHCTLRQTEIHGVPLGSGSIESIMLLYCWNINVSVHMWRSYHDF
jgi:hypothetical protein